MRSWIFASVTVGVLSILAQVTGATLWTAHDMFVATSLFAIFLEIRD